MTLEEATSTVAADLGELAEAVSAAEEWLEVRCASGRVAEVVARLRDGSLGFDWFTFMTAVDYPPGSEQGGTRGRLELHYHLRSLGQRLAVVLRCWVERDGESVPSVSGLFAGADWHERECFDLFGVVFAGHANLTRILLPDDWRGHPLRKDWQDPGDYGFTVERQWPEMAHDRAPEAPAPKRGGKEGA